MIGGTLTYRIGFLGYEGAWQEGEYDVELVSQKHGMTLGVRGLVPPRAFMSSVNISLCSSCGWEVAGVQGGAPPNRDFESVLRQLSAVRIRGGYYTGPEDVYLMSVALASGTASFKRDSATMGAEKVAGDPKEELSKWQVRHTSGGILGLNDTHLYFLHGKSQKRSETSAVPVGEIASVDVDEHGAITVIRERSFPV